MSRSIILDPRAERAANSPLEIFTEPGRGPGVYVTSHKYPSPEREVSTAGGREGKRRNRPSTVGNRTIPLELFVTGRREDYAANPINLVTNPVAALASTSWVGVGLLAGPTRVTPVSSAPVGPETVVEAQTDAAADALLHNAISLTNGVTYRASVYVRISALSATGIRLSVRKIVGGAVFTGATFSTVGQWQRIDLSFVANETAATWRIGVEQVGAGTATLQVVGLQVEATANLRDYFDGDSAGSSWTGAAHASTSTQPALADDHFEKIVADLETKLAELEQEGGTYSRPFRAGRGVFDVEGLAGGDDGEYDGRRWLQRGQRFATTLEARPHMRGPAVTKTLRSQTTDPVLVFTEENIPGVVSALGELEIADTATQARRGCVAGVEIPDYDHTAATAALYYQAEAMTPLGSAALAADAEATGAGNNTVGVTLEPVYREIFSTKIAATSKHLTHVGTFRVWARIKVSGGGFLDSGEVRLRLEWGQGDLIERTVNPEVIVPSRRIAAWYLVDLGTVRISKAKVGNQRWEGRIIARSYEALGSAYKPTCNIDDIRIVPSGFAYLRAKSPAYQPGVPVSYLRRDSFNQTAGALAGKIADVGGAWATSGAAGDFEVNTSVARARRTSISGAREAFLPSAIAGNMAARVTIYGAQSGWSVALLFRFIDANNFAALSKRGGELNFIWKVGGVSQPGWGKWGLPIVTHDLGVFVSASGYFALYYSEEIGRELRVPIYEGFAPDFATGGALASGQVGLLDSGGTTAPRDYDDFAVWAPPEPVLISAGRRLRWRHDGVVREDAAGGEQWSEVGYEGDPLIVPPSTKEGRAMRAIVFPTRGDLERVADGGNSDDFTAQLALTPRFLDVRV